MRLLSMVLCSCCLALAACSLITPSPEPTWMLIPSATQNTGIVGRTRHIAVGPVVIPAYLRRADLFIRQDEKSGVFKGGTMWSEPLDEGVTRVLAADLNAALSSKGMSAAPADFPMPLSKRVLVNVVRFDGAPGAEVVLEAVWSIINGQGGVLRTGRYVDVEKAGPELADLVVAHGVLLRRFADELAGPLAAR